MPIADSLWYLVPEICGGAMGKRLLVALFLAIIGDLTLDSLIFGERTKKTAETYYESSS